MRSMAYDSCCMKTLYDEGKAKVWTDSDAVPRLYPNWSTATKLSHNRQRTVRNSSLKRASFSCRRAPEASAGVFLTPQSLQRFSVGVMNASLRYASPHANDTTGPWLPRQEARGEGRSVPRQTPNRRERGRGWTHREVADAKPSFHRSPAHRHPMAGDAVSATEAANNN